jgi:hypothetical protein
MTATEISDSPRSRNCSLNFPCTKQSASHYIATFYENLNDVMTGDLLNVKPNDRNEALSNVSN